MVVIAILGVIGSYSGAIWYIRGQFADVKTDISGVRSDLLYLGKSVGRTEAENEKDHDELWKHINLHRETLNSHGQEIAVLKSSKR